jgi:hypothetical protein
MPELKSVASLAFGLALVFMAACSHDNGGQNGSAPRTNIDLIVTNFAVTPDSTDADDPLTLTGTVENIGAETANPLAGDSFLLYFNLSQDGTLELTEQGFAQKVITDPIPPGGSVPFTVTAPFGNGDTLSKFGNFCTSFGCTPPEAGVIGVKVDGAEDIRELDEGNNFQFLINQVVGTRVAASMGACDQGLSGGCNLTASDFHDSATFHLPCVGGGCSNTEVLLPNELHQFVIISMELVGCTAPVCGWGVTITSETQKPGLPNSKLQESLQCQSFPPHPLKKVCSFQVVVRDPNY